MTARSRAAALVIAAALAAGMLPGPASAQLAACGGDFPHENPQPMPGPPVRFGVAPSGAAGQIGPVPSAFEPDDPMRILSALARLRRPGRPFVAKVFHHYAEAGPKGDGRIAALVSRYSRAGYLVDLVFRYNPPGGEDVAGYVAWIRRQVPRYARNPRVIAFQITNEVTITFSPDSSDGAFEGARDALIRGVIAAHDETERQKARHIEVGFNWFYRFDPATEEDFWTYLRDRGGPRFTRAVDWVGLDAYPGTVFPPAVAGGVERDFMINAMSVLRQCLMPIPGLGEDVPIHVAENGWPTGPGRAEAMQADVLENMVRAVHDFRGTYHVSDYRWFTLRDADTESPNFQQHYGLLRDDYSAKPAFDRYRALVRSLSAVEVKQERGRAA